MTALAVLGNPNQFTFANAIVAANGKCRELFGVPLTRVFVIHSLLSQVKLRASTAWVEHLAENNINSQILVESVVEVESSLAAVEMFVDRLGMLIRATNEPSQLMVDLTNGTSLQKNLLSIAAYILDLPHQYLIDTPKREKLTNQQGFLPLNILAQCYVAAPDPTPVDGLAYLNLSEVVRYKRIIESHTRRYAEIDPVEADTEFFRGNLERATKLKLEGDRNHDLSLYRIASSAFPASAEELINLLLARSTANDRRSLEERSTLGAKLHWIAEQIQEQGPDDFDLEFLRKFNDFILYLRNSTTHKGKPLSDLERFKADLSLKMAFPFLEYYTGIVQPAIKKLRPTEERAPLQGWRPLQIQGTESLFFGLDGDDTGEILERCLLSSPNEQDIKRLSHKISKAISEIVKCIRKNASASIVFDTGDDILFKGCFTIEDLRNMQEIYTKQTDNLTCCIGYGRSLQELYVALKLAKSQPGKGAIIGIETAKAVT